MKFLVTTLAILLSMTLLVAATPTPDLYARNEKVCISDAEAKPLMEEYISLYIKLDKNLARKILMKDLVVESTSLNLALGLPPGLTATSRDQYVGILEKTLSYSQASAQLEPSYVILSQEHTCDKLWIRWRDSSKPYNIVGFDEVVLTRTPGGEWKAKAIYGEYNAAYLYDTGLYPCNASHVGS